MESEVSLVITDVGNLRLHCFVCEARPRDSGFLSWGYETMETLEDTSTTTPNIVFWATVLSAVYASMLSHCTLIDVGTAFRRGVGLFARHIQVQQPT